MRRSLKLSITVKAMQEIVNKKKPRTLAKRVQALEAEVAELKRLMHQGGASSDHVASRDLEAWAGLFKDDPGFHEAVELGRAWREQQPKC